VRRTCLCSAGWSWDRAAGANWASSLRPWRLASGRAADCQAVDAQRRLADAHRHALALLAAGPHARIELHVVADHRHARERVRPVAHDGGALHGVQDLAVFDPERLAGGEHELAGRDVNLTTA